MDEGFQKDGNVIVGSSAAGNPREAYKDFVFERIRKFPEGINQEALSWSGEQVAIARREWACFLIYLIEHSLIRANLPKSAIAWKLKEQIETECVIGKMPEFFAIGSDLDLSHRPPLVKFPSNRSTSASIMQVPGLGIIRNRVKIYSEFSKRVTSGKPLEGALDAFSLISQIVVNDGELEESYTISYDMTLPELQNLLIKSKAGNPSFESLLREHSAAFVEVNSRLISEIVQL